VLLSGRGPTVPNPSSLGNLTTRRAPSHSSAASPFAARAAIPIASSSSGHLITSGGPRMCPSGVVL
jgi:hypothetical protein